jgi:surface protein
MSELALIKEQTLTNIGDAIREKTSTTDLIMPKDMPAKIRSISSGGGVDLNSLRNKQYRIIVDQANMHNQYIEYKLDTGRIDTFPHKSTDSADHLYENNGLVKFIIDLKPMEGYNVGSVKIHCDTDMFYDETFNGSYTFSEHLIAGDIHITEVTPATKATGIDFSYYINKWYGSNAYNTTELTEITKSILTNPAIKAISGTSANPTMKSMFVGAGSLVSIPKIVVDTSDVVSLTRMFDGCGALEKVDISGINTSKVERINSIISSCNALKSFDLSFMSTVSMVEFGSIATYCNNLEVLDFSGAFIIDPSKLLSYDSIINSCPNLKYIIFNQENIALLTNSNFTSSFSSFENTDTVTILIPGDQAKLDSIKSQIDQTQYTQYHIEIDLISNYTITKPGDGTVDIKKK